MAVMKVRYKGASDVREMTAKDLKQHGVEVDKDLVFDRDNRWSMNIEMTDKLEQIFRDDGAFTISAIKDDDTEAEPEATSAPLVEDDTANTVVMADTGQVDKKKESNK